MTVIHDTLTPDERRAFDAIRDREMARNRQRIQKATGVCWSGMQPDPFVMMTDAQMIAEARKQVAARAAWEASEVGKAHAQCALLRRLAIQLHAAAEAVEASLNRGDGSCRIKSDEAREIADEAQRTAITLQVHAYAEATDLMEAM